MSAHAENVMAIDFGSSNTTAMYQKDHELQNVVDSNGLPYISSMLSLNDTYTIGHLCKTEEGLKKNGNLILRSPKLYLSINSQSQLETLNDLNKGIHKEFRDGTVYLNGIQPLEICRRFISRVKEMAEYQSGRKFTTVAYSYPADYSQTLISNIDTMMKECGFSNTIKISEPVAAVNTYITENNIRSGKVLVIDIGGGTCDLSIVKCEAENAFVTYKRGNNEMGGVNIDLLVYKWVKEQIEKKFPNLYKTITPYIERKIMKKCIEIKEKLSRIKSITIYLSVFFKVDDDDDDDQYYLTISREEFETIIKPFVSDFIKFVERAVNEGEKSSESLDRLSKRFTRVVLVGGSSVIPLLQQKIRDLFPDQFSLNTDPRNAVVKGNFHFACQMLDQLLKKRTPLEITRGRPVRQLHIKNDAIPIVLLNNVVRDAINEPIALLSANGKCFRLLEKNTKFEEVRDFMITISSDHQKEIQLFFCERSNPLFVNNKYLGSLKYVFESGERLLSEPQFLIKVWMSFNSVFTVVLEDLKDGIQNYYDMISLDHTKQDYTQSTPLNPMINNNNNNNNNNSNNNNNNNKGPLVDSNSSEQVPENGDTEQYSEELYSALIKEIETKILSNLNQYIGVLSELAFIKRDHDKYNQSLHTLIARLKNLKNSIT